MFKRVLFLIFICCIASGCSKEENIDDKLLQSTESKQSSEKEYDTSVGEMTEEILKPNGDPDVLSEEFLSEPTPLNVKNELEYDKITVSLDKESYSLEDEVIKCTVKNGNVGKGFYYYYIPFIECYSENKWNRLSYYPPETQYDEQWYFCAIEGNDDIEYSTTITFDPQYVSDVLKEGKYRLVIFVGPNKYYVEFDLKK